MEAEISEETMDKISYHFDDCLCADCLKELEKN